MTNILNLDDYEKVTITIKKKEYELNIPTLDTMEEFDKHLEKLSKIEKPGDFVKFLKPLFVKPPSDEILNKIKSHQYNLIIKHIFELAKGDSKSIDAKKK